MDKARLDEYLWLAAQPASGAADLRLVELWRVMTREERRRAVYILDRRAP